MPPRASRHRNWVYTLNNFDDLHKSLLEDFDCRYLVHAHEEGENGTPHLQGYLCMNNPISLNGLKRRLGIQGIHLEPRRGTHTQARDYCLKTIEGDDVDLNAEERYWFEKGDPPMEPGDGDGGWALDYEDASHGDFEAIRLRHPARWAQYRSTFRAHYAETRAETVRARVQARDIALLSDDALRPWQDELLGILQGEFMDRRIIVVHDVQGNAGKTTFANWYSAVNPKTQVMRAARYIDMAYILDETMEVFMFDVERSCVETDIWRFVEAIKDGRVFSSKYECIQKRIAPNHCVVFCNHLPPADAWSADRILLITC